MISYIDRGRPMATRTPCRADLVNLRGPSLVHSASRERRPKRMSRAPELIGHESSERDRGEIGFSDPPRESTSMPVPVTQFERMDDSDDPASEPMNPATEPMIVVPYDPDIIVKEASSLNRLTQSLQ